MKILSMKRDNVNHRILRHGRKELGICTRCECEAEPGRTLCRYHALQNSKHCKAYYDKRKKLNGLSQS